jgi:hypothetical protein
MEARVSLDAVYAPSEDVVTREIEGELILVPLATGMGDAEGGNEIFTLNKTGRAIWNRLDGKKGLNDIAAELSAEFDDPEGKIKTDVVCLMKELARRKMVVVVGGA